MDIVNLLEAVRRAAPSTFKRPGAIGVTDSHGHMWYCFDDMCGPTHKNHRSFDSHQAMLQHLKARHQYSLKFVEDDL